MTLLTRRTFGQIVVMLLTAVGRRSPDVLTCPRCGRRAHPVCGVRTCSCYRDIPAGDLPLRWTSDGEGEQCPYCGFAAHADYWFDRSMDAAVMADGRSRRKDLEQL